MVSPVLEPQIMVWPETAEPQTMVLPQTIVAFTGGPTIQFTRQGLSGAAANVPLTLVSQQGTVYSLVVTPSGKVNWCAHATCP